MRLNERIHPPRVRLKVRTIAGARHLQRFPRRRPQSQNALLTVDLQRVFAQNFGKFSAPETPHNIHLPKPVLSRDVALGEEQVFQCRSLDGRNAVAVSRYFHRRRKAVRLNTSVKLR